MSSVLIVDDEPDVRLVARIILEGAGHAVTDANSGEEALADLEGGDRFDVVLLDIRMPGIDGWEVLHRLRKNPGNFVDLPVVIFTADMSTIEGAPVAFADNEFFLAKPFAADQLISTIESAAAA